MVCILSSVEPQVEAIHNYCAAHKKILIARLSTNYDLFQLFTVI